jgi:hypothetical protein
MKLYSTNADQCGANIHSPPRGQSEQALGLSVAAHVLRQHAAIRLCQMARARENLGTRLPWGRGHQIRLKNNLVITPEYLLKPVQRTRQQEYVRALFIIAARAVLAKPGSWAKFGLIALLMPCRLAICIAQVLSQEHFVERTNRIWASS